MRAAAWRTAPGAARPACLVRVRVRVRVRVGVGVGVRVGVRAKVH